jgi:iron complex outermembrane recepter protein
MRANFFQNKLTKFTLPLALLISLSALAQEEISTDTTRQLGEVLVQAFQYKRPVFETPASIGVVGISHLQRFNESTLVPSFNTVPGVRFEERSPGSYRLSIRGSTIRSPFGVRNVKVYWNDIPLTDPGGNTYLNQLDPAVIGSAEIVKGPGSSLYGAGTGGVLLLNSPVMAKGQLLRGGFQLGSFGSELWQLGYEEAGNHSSHQVQVLHQQADGYRDQTRMSRDMINSVFRFEVDDNQTLETYLFYSDLFYETPGGLTLAEFEDNPRQARPPAGVFPGAKQQNAHVSLRSLYMGVAHEYIFSKKWMNRTSVYGNLVNFKNAAIRNYDHRAEQSFGARTVTTFNDQLGQVRMTLLGGGEFQSGFLPTKSYVNNGGREGALLADDESSVFQYSLFGQGEVRWQHWSATAGLSFNQQQLTFQRLSDVGSPEEEITYAPELMPRVALMWNPTKKLALFSSYSRGFSPPTLAEINASNGVFNKDLQPETGNNFELGIRSQLLNNQLTLELTGYTFRLEETIVIRREDDGGEFFTNAGNTSQNGIEAMLTYRAFIEPGKFITAFTAWISYSYNHFRFGSYVKGQQDFSGNELTGTPANILSGGFDLYTRPGIYLRATCLYTDTLPLNDANTVYADAYLLPGVRIGYQHKRFEVYAGGENLLDETYSLGNDLNAAGGRYYNAAAGRNFYAGVKVNVAFQQK